MSQKHFDFWPAGLPRNITAPATNLFYNVEVSAARYPDKPYLIFFEAPLTFSRKIVAQPAAASCSSWASRVCPTVLTRA